VKAVDSGTMGRMSRWARCAVLKRWERDLGCDVSCISFDFAVVCCDERVGNCEDVHLKRL
jgi:hypothetical protein